MIAEQTATFLSNLFQTVPFTGRVELRSVPGTSVYVDPREGKYPLLEDVARGEWYFSMTVRGTKGNVMGGTIVWADVDTPLAALEQAGPLLPEPSNVVSSGHGTHLYWILSHMIDASEVVRLSQLARLAFHGDPAVCEPKRVMRLPGSTNRKAGKPEVPCALLRDSIARYDPELLEQHLVARVLCPFWEEGSRNDMILGISAVLARAGWSVDRVLSTVRAVCAMREDPEVANRITTATITVQKHDLGLAISAQRLREALGNDYGELLEALGITVRNGDLLIGGVTIGKMFTIERDLVEYFKLQPDWSFYDGVLARWTGVQWVASTPEELTASVFDVLGKMQVIMNGDPTEFAVTTHLARGISQVFAGFLSKQPLEPMSPNYLPMANGVLDLDSLRLLPHSPSNRNRWVLSLPYDPDATCPVWDRFMSEAVAADHAWLQEWVGYCLADGNPYERLVWLYGPPGTGKSTFLKVLNKVFGEASGAITADKITEYTVAALAGKRVAVCTEISSATLKTVVLKQLISGDPTDARHPYGRPFKLAFTGKFMFASNVLPPVDQGEGLWRRLAIVGFNHRPKVPDPTLQTQLDAELSGVINWALAGLQRIRDLGQSWPLSGSVQSLVREYEESSDLFTQFFQEEMVLTPGAEIPAKEIYNRYNAWMRERGQTAESFGTVFYHNLKNAGLEALPPSRVKGRLIRMWRGAQLVADAFSVT